MRLLHVLVATSLCGNVAAKMLLNKRAVMADAPQEHPRLGAVPALDKRDIIPWGGYFLLVREEACPSNTSKCGTTGCCPNGTFCFPDPKVGSYPVCCPDENSDCSEIVLRVYACADTSWTMWATSTSYFCCKADEVGTHANFEDRCLPAKFPVPSSIIVNSIAQQTKTVAQPTNTGSPGGGSQTTDTPNPDDSGSGSGTGSGSGSGASSPNNNGGDGGLPISATIAIAVLATVVGLGLVFMAWFLWYRSHKKKQIAAAAAGSGGTSELPGASTGPGAPVSAPQVAQVAATYPPPAATTVPVGFIPHTNTEPIPVSPQQNLAQTAVVPIHSTPSPGPSLDPPLGPPAYVPPHPHTQELHARGMTPVLEGFQGYGANPNSVGHGVSPSGEQELDGTGRAGGPSHNTGHPGVTAGGLEDCSPSPGETGHGRT